MPFKFPNLKHSKSPQVSPDGNANSTGSVTEATPRPSLAAKRKVVQDFIKHAGVQMQKMPTHRPSFGRKTKVRQPPSKRASRLIMDIDDDTLDRIMGSSKSGDGRVASDDFFAKQKQRVSSKKTSAVAALSPVSKTSSSNTSKKVRSAGEFPERCAGAPQFYVVKQNDRYLPQVKFEGLDAEEAAKCGRDCAVFGHSSFDAATLGLYKSRGVSDQRTSTHGSEQIMSSASELLEMPTMLGLQGNDPGTVGFEHFLQIPISDSTANPEDLSLLDKRKLIFSQPEQLGLRKLDLEVIIVRLTELGTLHQTRKEREGGSEEHNEQRTTEMYTELFATLLHPPESETSVVPESTSLKTQIEALLRVLGTAELWHDFSLVEWRIRVGQLLWAGEEYGAPLDEGREPSERDMLLLQIALASELLVRLDMLKGLLVGGTSSLVLIPADQEKIDSLRTPKIEWDLILAKRFLENLKVSAKMPKEASTEDTRKSFFSMISFFTANELPEDDTHIRPRLLPRKEAQQLAGLLYFAEAIEWPHTADIRAELEAKLHPSEPRQRPISTAASIYTTPLQSPRSIATSNRNSYFGLQQRPAMSRMTTAQSIQLMPAATGNPESDSFEVGGWLSRSWLTGLVLPGEAASHFLISTLLENSLQAIDALGDAANLYGGFVYHGRTFWSKSCVVGRVLAATTGARDCMGWISVPGTVDGHDDGWLSFDVKELPTSHTPRIADGEKIAKDSDALHGNAYTTLQDGDFTFPADGAPVMGNEVHSHGLSFVSSATTFEPTHAPDSSGAPTHHDDSGVGAQPTSIANLAFSSPINPKLAELHIPLTYDVHFISSYPCYPQSRHKASSPTVGEQSGLESQLRTTPTSTSVTSLEDKGLPPAPTHPLHIDFHFDIVPVATLLSASGRERAASAVSFADAGATKQDGGQHNDEIIVLDCRGTADLELLARAWCAKAAENALVGKSGRTCLACCVREARALGVRIVIRI